MLLHLEILCVTQKRRKREFFPGLIWAVYLSRLTFFIAGEWEKERRKACLYTSWTKLMFALQKIFTVFYDFTN